MLLSHYTRFSFSLSFKRRMEHCNGFLCLVSGFLTYIHKPSPPGVVCGWIGGSLLVIPECIVPAEDRDEYRNKESECSTRHQEDRLYERNYGAIGASDQSKRGTDSSNCILSCCIAIHKHATIAPQSFPQPLLRDESLAISLYRL